jgi:hypothetical protein
MSSTCAPVSFDSTLLIARLNFTASWYLVRLTSRQADTDPND